MVENPRIAVGISTLSIIVPEIYNYIIISGVGGYIAISGYLLLSQSFGGTSFKFVMVEIQELPLKF